MINRFRAKFKSFIEQYELREIQFQSILRMKELEVQYQLARYENQRKAQEQDASKNKQLTSQVSTFSQTETELRSQLNIYVEKFKQVSADSIVGDLSWMQRQVEKQAVAAAAASIKALVAHGSSGPSIRPTERTTSSGPGSGSTKPRVSSFAQSAGSTPARSRGSHTPKSSGPRPRDPSRSSNVEPSDKVPPGARKSNRKSSATRSSIVTNKPDSTQDSGVSQLGRPMTYRFAYAYDPANPSARIPIRDLGDVEKLTGGFVKYIPSANAPTDLERPNKRNEIKESCLNKLPDPRNVMPPPTTTTVTTVTSTVTPRNSSLKRRLSSNSSNI
jgi:hypothetical protein